MKTGGWLLIVKHYLADLNNRCVRRRIKSSERLAELYLHMGALGDPDRSHLVRTTRTEAAKEFPEFWNQLADGYAGKR